jgi:hypothetical protein
MAGGETTLASRYRLEVDTSSTPETPTWGITYGLQSFTKSTTPTDQDDSDFEDGGWKSSARTAQQWTASATLLLKKNAAGDAIDPVHAKLQAAGRALGEAAKVRVRVYDREGLEDAEVVTVLVTWEASGSGTEDLGTADVTLTGCGAPVFEDNPNAPVTP